MQAPPFAQPASKGRVGYIIALVGSALSILSFFAFSISTSPSSSGSSLSSQSSSSSTTFIQFAQQLQDQQQQLQAAQQQMQSLPDYGNTSGGYANLLASYDRVLHLVPFIWAGLAITIAAFAVALVFTIRPPSPAIGGAVGSLILGLIGVGVFLYIIITIAGFISDTLGILTGTPANGFSYIGFGAWVCVVGMVAAAVGGIIAMTNRPSVAAAGYGAPPQPPQYPANAYTPYSPQQPPSPNYPPQQPPYPSYPPQQPPQW